MQARHMISFVLYVDVWKVSVCCLTFMCWKNMGPMEIYLVITKFCSAIRGIAHFFFFCLLQCHWLIYVFISQCISLPPARGIYTLFGFFCGRASNCFGINEGSYKFSFFVGSFAFQFFANFWCGFHVMNVAMDETKIWKNFVQRG